MRYLLYLILAGSLSAQVPADPVDKNVSLAVISAFQKAGTMFSGARPEFMRVTPFWKNIYRLSVPYGLNKDPVPDPAVFYIMPDTTFVNDFLSVLKKLKYHPQDKADALTIAILLVQDADPHAVIPQQKADLEKIPKKLRKKYDVELPDVDGSFKKEYEVEVFSYQAFQQHSFSRQGRMEELKQHEITIKDGAYDWQVKEFSIKW
jgi:hypothetical protein